MFFQEKLYYKFVMSHKNVKRWYFAYTFIRVNASQTLDGTRNSIPSPLSYTLWVAPPRKISKKLNQIIKDLSDFMNIHSVKNAFDLTLKLANVNMSRIQMGIARYLQYAWKHSLWRVYARHPREERHQPTDHWWCYQYLSYHPQTKLFLI